MKKITYIIFLTIKLNAQIQVFDNFEGGNVNLIFIEPLTQTIFFEPSLKNEKNTIKCWYFFGLTNYKKDTINFISRTTAIFNSRYPAYSYDKKNWEIVNNSVIFDSMFLFKILPTADTLYVATGLPYLYSDLIKYIIQLSVYENVFIDSTCKSNQNRQIYTLQIMPKHNKAGKMIWVIARQHAFETTTNYFLEGFLNYILKSIKSSTCIFNNYVIFAVPMVDVDNVYSGATGRMQKPRDFNRDWLESGILNKEIACIKNKIDSTQQLYRYALFFDIHSTYPSLVNFSIGYFNDFDKKTLEYKNLRRLNTFFYQLAKFSMIEFRSQSQNNYADFYNSKKLSKEIDIRFATTIECGWKVDFGKKNLADDLREMGQIFAKALELYLLDSEKPED